MEFRKMITITLYVRQQKRHRCLERSFGLVGEGEYGMIWENGIETYVYYFVRNELPVYVRCRIQDAWGWFMGMIQRDLGWEVGGGSCLGTHVHPWWIHVNVWQNQYSIVK